MDGAPIQDGGVRVVGDRIVEVARFSELSKQMPTGLADANHSGDEEIMDLGESVLLPGLINAHCHLDYTCLRGKIPRPRSFADWIRAINLEKARLTPADYLHSIAEGVSEAQRFGTTSIVNLEAFPELIAELDAMPLRIWWCAELIDVTTPGKSGEIVRAAMAEVKSVPPANSKRFGLAPHAPFTASKSLYQVCAELGRRENFLLTTHLAESDEEMKMFHQQSGPLFDFLKSIGRPMEDCGKHTSLSVFLENICGRGSNTARREPLLGKWIVAHLNELCESDFELLSNLPAKISVVHCPRSHAYFGRKPFAFEKLDEIGCNVCLGTDSLASNEDLSLFREMREVHRSYPSIPSRQILEMVTVNAAKAIGQPDHLGKIRADYQADMIAIPFESQDVHDSILAFDGEVPWAMIAGEVAKFCRFPLSFSQS